MYRSLHSDDPGTNRSVPLPRSAFEYSDSVIDKQIVLYIRMQGERPLSLSETNFWESLELSKFYDTFTEPTYIKQSTLVFGKDPKNRENDRGYHYDWRFLNSPIRCQESCP